MASLQRVKVHGHSYWRIVESRRVNGKPRPVVIAHLGKAADILARLNAAESLRLRSREHGSVAALWALASELDVAGAIDRQLAAHGARPSKSLPKVKRTAKRHDGLSVGESITIAAIGRACHATSKRGFAEWASTTTLGDLADVEIAALTSQHFWDQMDQVPVASIGAVESELVQRAINNYQLPVDTLLYDATNFFTFIATTNERTELAARGHNKQKRHDLRQVSVAMLCTSGTGVPLLHHVYGGQIPDTRSFVDVLPLIRERLVALNRELTSLTVVYDKGNVSRANQKLVDKSGMHYVAALTATSCRVLISEANPHLQPILVGEERVMTYRTRTSIWGTERTAVVLLSERLRDGQLRGIKQHLASAIRWLTALQHTLDGGKQRRDKVRIERDIESRLMGRQHLKKILRVSLNGDGRRLKLKFTIDEDALEEIRRDWLGRLVLITDREDWTTDEIIRTYRGQSHVEAVFAHLKDPIHVALRPQFHWTDQKLHVHVFTCVIGFLLAKLLHLKAQRQAGFTGSMERLLEMLTEIRRVTIARSAGGKGRMRIVTQIEDTRPEVATLAAALGLTS